MKTFIATLLLAFAALAFGQSAEVAKPDSGTEKRLKHLAEELRCLVCQNQTIADSHAGLAVDLRNQIRGQIAEGKSDDQIRDYMVARYGDFVLYRPPFKATTAVLWLGPAALLVFGAGVYFMIVRRRKAEPTVPPPSKKRQAELEKLLED